MCEKFVVGDIGTNSYLVKEKYLVDPGGMSEKLKDRLEECRDHLSAILLTHAHWDHIAGIPQVREIIPDCPVFCHPHEAEVLKDPQQNFSTMGGDPLSIDSDGNIMDESLSVGDSSLQLLETPGHTTGSISIYWESRDLLFAGDTLFKGGIGRTDLPGGDSQTLLEAIRNKFFKLPESTKVLPGHGPATTIERERKSNPFLNR